MIFYILLPNDTEEDCINDANQLGHVAFKKFYKNSGYEVLTKIIDMGDIYIINNIRIVDSNKKVYTIEKFLQTISKYKIA